MGRRKTTINPGFIGRRPSQWGQPPLTPAPSLADNTSSSDKESGEPDSSSVDSIVEGEGKPEPVTIDVDEFDEREDDKYFEEEGGEVNEEEDEKEEENENNGMDEQVGSRTIQLFSLDKPNQSYKEDGQLQKNLKPTRKSMGKPNSFGEEEGEIVEEKQEKFTVGKYVVAVNPDDEEDCICQENLIESYLVKEMLRFKEETETPRSTSEPVETKKIRKNSIEKRTHIQKWHEESGKLVRSPKETALGKSELSIVQMSLKSDTSTHQSYPENNKNAKETAFGKPELFPVQISGKTETSICQS